VVLPHPHFELLSWLYSAGCLEFYFASFRHGIDVFSGNLAWEIVIFL